MRLLHRNRAPFWYSNYESKTEIVDDNGYRTGEYQVTRSDITKVYATITSGTESAHVTGAGNVDMRQYGLYQDYDRIILLDDPETPIRDEAVIWYYDKIDRHQPGWTEPTSTTPHNYQVRKLSRSLNNCIIAIKKVTLE